ncbi:MAG: outer membrane beta-barrel protein [Methylovulum sp.]|nr:outer membrane beta-barrel protein [Methylovulum sp.]
MRLCFDTCQFDSKKSEAGKRYLLAFCIMLAGQAMPGKSEAMASPEDTIKSYAAVGMVYDSNFLRLSDQVDPVLATGKRNKDDFIKQVSAGVAMDWTVSRQHLIIKADTNQNWFQNFTALDYLGWDAETQWNWQIGNELNGEIGYGNNQKLGSFARINTLVPNLQNNQRYFANGGYLFHPRGKIKLGVFREEYLFDDKSRQISNNIEDNAELNLQYLSPTGSILGLRLLTTDGQYPQRQFTAASTQDNAYTRVNTALTYDWHVSEITRFNGWFGYTQQHYAHLSARDFSGVTARFDLTWRASEKTQLELVARREISQALNLFTNFVLIQGANLNLTWQPTAKITLMLPASYQQQTFLGGGDINAAGSAQQKDNVGNLGMSLTYSPLANLSVGTVLNYEKRESTDPLRTYESQSAGINIQAAF